jgi:hypothetical protein|tara:strand:+ start:193 stop:555 length:363 start_codon:yes stop_codon:yes gene_type:complete
MKHQKGLTMVSILLLVLGAIVILRAFMVIIPSYFDHAEVGVILDSLDENNRINAKTSTKVMREEVARRLRDNNVAFSVDTLEVQRSGAGAVINWNYESRKHFLANIDMVLTFQRQKELTK